MRIILATSNTGKLREMRAALADLPVELLEPSDVGEMLTIEEDGETFAENALKKARAYVDWFGIPAIADDSGLEVDALDGAPGVHSKRWLGADVPESELVPSLLKKLLHTPMNQRGAQFRAAVAFALPDGRYFIEEGTLRGSITNEPSDIHLSGLPYRKIFYIEKYDKCYADLTPEENATIHNHRAVALSGLVHIINKEGLI